MQRMLAIEAAILLEFELALNIAPVLAGCIVPAITFTALKRYQLNSAFLCLCHSLQSPRLALERVRPNARLSQELQPSIGLEPMTPSLPWMCSTD